MKKTLLTLVALAGMATAQAQAPVKAWYKTWITPERCVTGITEITYNAENDYYTVKDGLMGDAGQPFHFGIDTDDKGNSYLRLYGFVYDYDKDAWSAEQSWNNSGSYIGMYLNSTTNDWTDIYSGSYFTLADARPGEGAGALYFYGDVSDEGGGYVYNYYCQPSLIWPATEPTVKTKGKYTNRLRQTKECELWVYANGVYVIKGFNGIAGYDIAFNPNEGSVQGDGFIPGLYNPSAYPDYTFGVYERMAKYSKDEAVNNIAKVMNIKNVEAEAGKVTFTYDYINYDVYNGKVTATLATDAKDTFTWDATTTGINSAATVPASTPAEYYNVGGSRVTPAQRGLVIRKQGGKVVKMMR